MVDKLLMNYIWGILMLISVSSYAGQGPCVRKLLVTGDKVQYSDQFTMYLQSLLEQQIITIQHIEPFLSALEQDKLLNPIPRIAGVKFEFHHQEFESLLNSGKVDLVRVQEWTNVFIKKINTTEKERKKSKQNSTEVPVYISPDGSMFYRVQHPLLGESYQILKPGGRYDVEGDWEKIVWPVNALKKKSGDLRRLTNHRGLDPLNNKLVSKKSSARKACIDLGESIDLPTLEDYQHLISHFENKGKKDLILTEKGIEKFRELFPDSESKRYWSSSVHFNDTRYAWLFYSNSEPSDFIARDAHFSVRCVSKRQTP